MKGINFVIGASWGCVSTFIFDGTGAIITSIVVGSFVIAVILASLEHLLDL